MKTRDGARQGSCFKKLTQDFSYRKRNKLPVQQVDLGLGKPINPLGRCFKKRNHQFSYQKINKIPD